MKLTIRNYNIMAGVQLMPGWKLAEVKEYDHCYEFHCLNIIGDEERYLRLDREPILNDRFCWEHSVNRGPDMKMFRKWPTAVDEIGYELNYLINNVR